MVMSYTGDIYHDVHILIKKNSKKIFRYADIDELRPEISKKLCFVWSQFPPCHMAFQN